MDWGPYAFLAGLGVLSFGVLGGAVYLATRRRWARAGQALGWIALALTLASLVPAPLPAEASTLTAVLQGKGHASVLVDPKAPVFVTPGATLAGGDLSWDCPSGCSATGGTTSLRLPPYARSARLANDTVTLEDGKIDIYEGRVPCAPIPLLFATLFGAFTCEAGCRERLHAEGTSRFPEQRLVATGTKLCA